MKKINILPFYLIIIGILGFILILGITPFGIGVSPDSTTYIAGGKNLLSGNGYSVNGNPITAYPPLYSLSIGTTGFLANNILQAAHLLNAILFGVNLALFALAIYWSAGRNYITATGAALFFLTTSSFLRIHSYAWSEPLFIAFCIACIILLSMYIVKPTFPLLIASSLSLGFALVTRFSGLGFLPAALAILFIGRNDQKLGFRIRASVIWLILACAPLVAFLTRNAILMGGATGRNLSYHPIAISEFLKDIKDNVSNFITPISLPHLVGPIIYGLITIFFFALLIILVRMYRRHFVEIDRESLNVWIPISCILFTASYFLFLYISISVMDASTPVDERLLSPVLIIMTIGSFSALWTITQKLKMPLVWLGFLFIVALSIINKSSDAINTATDIRENGLGYTSREWQNSETIAFVRLQTNNVKIYSNASEVLNFLVGGQSIFIPSQVNPLTMEPNPNSADEILAMCKDVRDGGALLVYFNQITSRWYQPTEADIVLICQLPVLQSFADGTVYGVTK